MASDKGLQPETEDFEDDPRRRYPVVGLEMDMVYPTQIFIQEWGVGVQRRKKWYTILKQRSQVSTDVVRACSDHFALTTRLAMETLARVTD